MATTGHFPLSGLEFTKQTYMAATLFSLAVLIAFVYVLAQSSNVGVFLLCLCATGVISFLLCCIPCCIYHSITTENRRLFIVCGRVSFALAVLSVICSLTSLGAFFTSAQFNLIHLALFTLFAFSALLFHLTFLETRVYEAKTSKSQAIDFSVVVPVTSQNKANGKKKKSQDKEMKPELP